MNVVVRSRFKILSSLCIADPPLIFDPELHIIGGISLFFLIKQKVVEYRKFQYKGSCHLCTGAEPRSPPSLNAVHINFVKKAHKLHDFLFYFYEID